MATKRRMSGDQSKSYLSEIERLAKNGLNSFAYEKVALGGAPSFLTAPADAKFAVIRLESTELTAIAARMLQNKSIAVTTLLGYPLYNKDVVEVIDQKNIVKTQFISVTGTNNISVEYFK
jgi:hypothetical protein